MAKLVILDFKKKKMGGQEIAKAKFEDEECLPLDKTTSLQATRIQSSVKAFVSKNSHPNFIKYWLINNETNGGLHAMLEWGNSSRNVYPR